MAAKSKAGASAAKPPSKSEIYTNIADETGLTKKDVAAVFDSLAGQIKKNLGGRGAPGEEMMFKAKPASKGVKVLALKALKDMV